MRRMTWLIWAGWLTWSALAQTLPYDLIEKGNRAYYDENYSEAEVYYRKALEAFPDSLYGDSAFVTTARRLQATLAYNLGNAVYQQGRHGEAVKYYQQAAQVGIDDTIGYYALYNAGNALASSKKWDPAIEAYKNVLRHNPYDSAARHNLVYALMQKKKNSKKNDKNKNNKQQNQNQQQKQNQNQKNSSQNNQQQQKKQDKQKNQQQPQKNNPQQNHNASRQRPNPSPHQLDRRRIEQLLKAAREEEKKARKRAALRRARTDRRGKRRPGQPLQTDKDW